MSSYDTMTLHLGEGKLHLGEPLRRGKGLVHLGKPESSSSEVFKWHHWFAEPESSSTLSALVLPSCLSAPSLLDFHSLFAKHYRMRD